MLNRISTGVAGALLLAACSSRAVGPRPAPDVRRDAAGVAQVWVPAGSFRMGTSDDAMRVVIAMNPPRWVARALPAESPAHEVRITRGFWIDRTEVTNAAFAAFAAAGGYGNRALWSDSGWAWRRRQPAGSLPATCEGSAPDQPRACVTWYEAEAYATWRGGRLPSEAEWEYAARGPGSRVYPWGDQFDGARCNVVGAEASVAVGGYPSGASWVGALDMAGNVMEWVQDWLDADYYQRAPAVDPPGPASGERKVEKGGWWGGNQVVARSAYRHYEDPPTYQDHHIGFRIVTP